MEITTVIVEDDPMVSRINQRYLEKITLMKTVGVARHGHQGLELIELHRPALVLLDIYMPSYTGMDLLRDIRKRYSETDVILITAADKPDIIEESMRLGVVDYIIKPFDFERFQSALELFKHRYLTFRQHESFDQKLLDSLRVGSQSVTVHEQYPFPKGIDPMTLQSIRHILGCANSSVSAQDIADKMQLSRITTRKYLEYLCEEGIVTLELRYAEKGRPTKLYALRDTP